MQPINLYLVTMTGRLKTVQIEQEMQKHGKMKNSGRKREPGISGRGQNEGVTVFSERGRERGRVKPQHSTEGMKNTERGRERGRERLRDSTEGMKSTGTRRQEQELSPESIHKLEKSTGVCFII